VAEVLVFVLAVLLVQALAAVETVVLEQMFKMAVMEPLIPEAVAAVAMTETIPLVAQAVQA
jgi:hypothetical protein